MIAIIIVIIITIACNVLDMRDLEHYKFMGTLPKKKLPVETRYSPL